MTPRIKIIIPFYSEFDFVKPGLRHLMLSGIEFDCQPVQGPYIHTNRNLGVNSGKSSEIWQEADPYYSHYLFIDSDISFTPDHVRAALNHNAPVVTLPYLRHENDGKYQVGEMDLDYQVTHRYSMNERGLRHVTFTGAGFLLVRQDVFQNINFPWFHFSTVEIGSECFSVGEDQIFARKLTDAMIPILCDFDHPVLHRLRKMEDYDVSF